MYGLNVLVAIELKVLITSVSRDFRDVEYMNIESMPLCENLLNFKLAEWWNDKWDNTLIFSVAARKSSMATILESWVTMGYLTLQSAN